LKKTFIFLAFAGSLFLLGTVTALAGSADIQINCKSASGRTTISGYVPGDSIDYDLKLNIDGTTMRYVDACNDAHCSKRIRRGFLFAVSAIKKRVFTVAFANKYKSNLVSSGFLYAIPSTVKYQKKAYGGYRAQYKAIYNGADPRSKNSPKDYVKDPIELTCVQKYEI